MDNTTEFLPKPTALLDPKAAAILLNCSDWTLAEWRCSGSGPRFIKVGRLVRYALEDLQVWIEGQKVISTSEHSMRKAG